MQDYARIYKTLSDLLRMSDEVMCLVKRVITDRGTAFTSNEIEEYCFIKGIQHLIVIAIGVPKINGQVERMNRIIVLLLAKMCDKKPSHKYQYVEKSKQTINNSPSRSTQTHTV